jgi:hypothetical protein
VNRFAALVDNVLFVRIQMLERKLADAKKELAHAKSQLWTEKNRLED